MLLSISHTTHYSYTAPVDYALQQIRLTPQTNRQQDVLDWTLEVEGGEVETSYRDFNGTQVHLVSVTRGGQSVAITAAGKVQTNDTNGVLGMTGGPAPLWYFLNVTDLTRPGPGIDVLARKLSGSGDQLSGLHALSADILDAVPYVQGRTYVATAAEDAFSGGAGVCQDHAQIFVSAARAAGIPAPYVSGYLMMPDLTEQDASHAWAEAHVDGLGWVGFDVSNSICPDEHYVRLASGLDYTQTAPISGMRLGNAQESMIVSLQIQQ